MATFLELEAVAPADSDLTREYQLVAELRDALRITDETLCANGYADCHRGDVLAAPRIFPQIEISDRSTWSRTWRWLGGIVVTTIGVGGAADAIARHLP